MAPILDTLKIWPVRGGKTRTKRFSPDTTRRLLYAGRVISDTFRLELLKRRAAGQRVYQIAQLAGVRANELSGITTGSITPRHNDPRVLRVAAFLGLTPEECFVSDDVEAVSS